MRIAILGLGQMGGSLALAVKSAYSDVEISGYDAKQEHADILHKRGGIQRICTTPEEAVKAAEIIFFASPLRSYPELATRIAPHVSKDCIISDVGSAQQCLHQAFAAYPELTIIPSHPIAGSERDGPEASREDLFRSRLLLLTPHQPDTQGAKKLAEFWHGLGCNVVFMPSDLHDGIYAHVSHLPHLLVFAAGLCLHSLNVRMHADQSVLKQFLRIGMSNTRMWADIFIENRAELQHALAQIIAMIKHMATELESGANDAQTTSDEAEIAARFLPRMVASSLISCVQMFEEMRGINLKHFSGAGLRDATAPASLDPESELAAMSDNAAKLAGVLKHYTEILSKFLEALTQNNHDAVTALIASAREATLNLHQKAYSPQ